MILSSLARKGGILITEDELKAECKYRNLAQRWCFDNIAAYRGSQFTILI